MNAQSDLRPGNSEVTSTFKAICDVLFALPEQLWGCSRMRCAAGDPLSSGWAGAREAGLASSCVRGSDGLCHELQE